MSAAIVTGGSAGIGRAVVERLLASGNEVISPRFVTGQVLYVCGGTSVGSLTL